MYIVLAILVFGVLIFVHELGHFLAAKRLGVQVNEFAINMGPVLWKRTKGETTYSLRAIPIGGFCAMEGQDENLENPRAFTSVKWWRRLIILAAGSVMNLLAGFLILVLLLLPRGTTMVSTDGYLSTPTIDRLVMDDFLKDQGLREGDTLYKMDGERVYVLNDFSMLTMRNPTGVFDLVVLRDGQQVELDDFELKTRPTTVDGVVQQKYGINFASEKQTLATVLERAWNESRDFVRLVRLGLQDLFTGAVGLRDMSGVVGIVHVISETGSDVQAVAGVGIAIHQVLYLAAFIAVNLAVMNLLPIPALDGGRIVCMLLTVAAERVLHRRIDPKYEGYLHAAGMLLLLAFMALVSFSDVFKLFGK